MRIINDTNLIKLPDDSTCRFFVQIWYSMVHRNSLDSHRVRSMNSLNILRELGDLISKEDLPNILDDIKRAAEEALDIMQKDKIISLHFEGLLERIKPLLEEIIKASKSKGIKDSPSFFMLRYLTRDFTTDLIQRYKHCIIEELEKSIFKTKSEDNIFAYTGTLLSVLIDEGHSIEELFGFAKNIFVERRGDTAYAFEKSFNFMKRLIDHPDYEYDIIFRLEGFKKKELVPSIIGDVEFLEIFTIESDERVSAFLSPGLNVLLGKTRVKAQDDRSAGAIAKKKLDDILDLIRFEMEHEIITVSQEFVSLRLSNSSSRVFKLPSQIPNPNKNITAEEFEQFVKSISEVLDSKTIHRESKERIKSAIRFYRMGRDSEQFENKYLNWWTALEYLLRSNEGKIIEQIEDKLKTILVLNYTAKHLCSFRNTFLSCGLRPSPKICQQFSIESYELLPLYDIFAAIHNADEMAHINGRLSSYPAVKFHLDRFVSQTRNPNDLLNTLSNHEDHVRWQIHRIWRLRCDIVHSAEYSVNLVLLSANIEYYLKYLLSEMLGKLCNNRAIESLAELFDRMSYSYDRLKSDLKNGKMDFHSEILRTGLI